MRDTNKIRLARVLIAVLPRMPRWVCVLAARALMRAMQRYVVGVREPDFEVVRGSDREVYLRRWWVIPRNDQFNIYLHNMLRDDDDVLHDHMYESWSLCLGGELLENYRELPPTGTLRSRVVGEGDVTIRSSILAHQLVVKTAAWTIFVTGPRVKEWGFWCPRGFRHWRDYVSVTQDPSVQGNGAKNTSTQGQGCGEMS